MRIPAALVLVLLAPAAAASHEIGTTSVRLSSDRAGHWVAAVTTGPQALLNRLEAETGQPRSRGLDAASLRERLESLLPVITSHLDLRFDGARCPVIVTIDTLDVPLDVTRAASMVLTAGCEATARPAMVSWALALVSSSYPLVLDHGGEVRTVWIEGGAGASMPLAAAATPARAVGLQYLRLGFEHILPKGVDHILFVAGLFLLTRSMRPMLLQVTSFTLAHSLTLGLTMYGVVALPSRLVEPLIAISIVYVAIDNIVTARVTLWRPAVVFAFGLLHGMGFAGVLQDLGLPRTGLVPALVGFNAGIELAQLTLIGIAFACTHTLWRAGPRSYRAHVVVPGSAAIAAIALVWTVQRVAG